MSDIETMTKELGITDEQALKVKKLYEEIESKIVMDDNFNCTFPFHDMIIHMRPLTRKLSRDYTIFLQVMSEKKKKDMSGLSKYNKYQDLVENSLRYTILKVRDGGDPLKDVPFDIDELPDPLFDELVLYLNVYFQKYKKK